MMEEQYLALSCGAKEERATVRVRKLDRKWIRSTHTECVEVG